MKQDEKSGKRTADGVGESKHAGRWSGWVIGDAEQFTEPPRGPCQASSRGWAKGDYRSFAALGRRGLSFAEEQSRNVRSLDARTKHETPGKDPAVPPFHHH